MACQLLEVETKDIIDMMYDIVTKLEAREISNNCVSVELLDKSWTQLCEDAI